MKVKIKSWERMVEEFGYWGLDECHINLKTVNWHTALECEIPDDRIIEVSIESHRCRGVKEKAYYYRDYGISPDAIEEYLTDELGNDLTNPLHPANYELLPELKSEEVLEQHCKDCKFHMYGSLDEPCDSCDIKTHSNFEKREVDESFSNLPNPEPQQEFKLKPIAEILEEESKPKAIEIFLGSGKIKGIGPQIAKKIVQKADIARSAREAARKARDLTRRKTVLEGKLKSLYNLYAS